MAKLYHYLRDFLKEDFDVRYYGITLLLLLSAWYINYHFGYNEAIKTLAYRQSAWTMMGVYFLCFALPYFIILLVMSLIRKDFSWTKNAEFWLKIMVCVGVLSVFRGNSIVGNALIGVKAEDYFFLSRFYNILLFYLIMALPIGVVYFWKDRRTLPFLYGITREGFDWKMYLPIIILALIAVYASSFSPNFLGYYPIMKPEKLTAMTFMSPRTGLWLYEFFYAGIFVITELTFRGLLIIGMAHILGKNAILPMVALYCFVHFTKPSHEALLSIFGGYALGILALKTRNIWGGIFLHLIVGMGMEFFAMWQS